MDDKGSICSPPLLVYRIDLNMEVVLAVDEEGTEFRYWSGDISIGNISDGEFEFSSDGKSICLWPSDLERKDEPAAGDPTDHSGEY
jgi:hypothetical protein